MTNCSCGCGSPRLSPLSPEDVEECQLSECGAEEELGGGDAALQRSSSTSDITQQLSDSFPGTPALCPPKSIKVFVEGFRNAVVVNVFYIQTL